MLILEPVPDQKRYDVVIGLVIRKPQAVVRACLDQLLAQVLPLQVTTRFHLIFDTDDPAVIHEADRLPSGTVVECEEPVRGDFADDGPVTHHWTNTSMARVGALKNRILARALAEKADAVWLVDADLLCDVGTLKSLWYADNPVVSAVFWTRWNNSPQVHAAPQVWLRHPYILDGRGYPNERAFRRRLLTRQLTTVWGLGACTLIRRSVLEAGVSFAYLPGVSQEGMMAGEDRHFCLACESRHIPMVADPWPHIFHVYHADQIAEIPERLEALNVQTADPAQVRWVSLRLKLLEPIPTGPGTLGLVPPHIQRVRIGADHILPDLERQVLQHLDGQPFVASLCYPADYEVEWLAGKRRLMDVTVIEAKTGEGMPVIEDEFYEDYDLTTYSTEQQQVMA